MFMVSELALAKVQDHTSANQLHIWRANQRIRTTSRLRSISLGKGELYCTVLSIGLFQKLQLKSWAQVSGSAISLLAKLKNCGLADSELINESQRISGLVINILGISGLAISGLKICLNPKFHLLFFYFFLLVYLQKLQRPSCQKFAGDNRSACKRQLMLAEVLLQKLAEVSGLAD